MTGLRRWVLVAGLLGATIACDQASKVVAKERLQSVPPRSFLADTFRLTYAENPGAFLSLGAALPQGARFWVLNVGVALVLAALLVHAVAGKDTDTSQVAAYALVVGGGLGNWIDRVLRGGTVVDFMNLGLGPVRTGVFNVADVAIMVGAGVLLLGSVRRKPARVPQTPAPIPDQAASSPQTPPPGVP